MGDGTTDGTISDTLDIAATGTFIINLKNAATYAGTITGAAGAAILANGPATVTYSGTGSAYAGTTTVNAGEISITGSLGGDVGVQSGGTLSGTGTIGGDVTIASGANISGKAGATLAISGGLSIDNGAVIEAALNPAQPNATALFSSNALTLAATSTLKTSGGSLGAGTYAILAFGAGGLTGTAANISTSGVHAGLGLTPTIADTPSGSGGTVNLVLTQSSNILYWNGSGTATSLVGGNGTWSVATANTDWADANPPTQALAWVDNDVAIFDVNPGTVKVDNGPGAIEVAGMKFEIDGYVITDNGNADVLTLVPGGGASSEIMVVNSGDTAAISVVLGGTTGLHKTGDGTLALSANNTYTGGTFVTGGTLSITGDASLGQSGTSLAIDGATLVAAQTMTTGRALLLGSTGATIDLASGVSLTVSGIVADETSTGQLTKTGAGTLALSGVNTYSGGTVVTGGTVQISGDSGLGDGAGALTLDGGTLAASQTMSSARAVMLGTGGGTFDAGAAGNVVTWSGVIGDQASANGALTKAGDGTLVLSGPNTYSGGTTIAAGKVQISVDNNLGAFHTGVTLAGGTALEVSNSFTMQRQMTFNSGSVALNVTGASDTLTLAGAVTGSGDVTFGGAGSLVLSGSGSSFTGTTAVTLARLTLSGKLAGTVSVASGSSLAGTGLFKNDVVIAGGATLVGTQNGVLTVGGTLTLQNGSAITMTLDPAAAGAPAQFNANTLVLQGSTLDVSGTALSTGRYALFDYGNGGLTGGASDITVQNVHLEAGLVDSIDTSVTGEVDLLVTAGQAATLYWNGAGNGTGLVGGDGVWSASQSVTTWTNNTGGTTAQPWITNDIAVFQANAGTVEVDSSAGPVTVAGMIFNTGGYELADRNSAGNTLTLAPSGGSSVEVRIVDTGSPVTISVALAGDTGLNKTGIGTLLLQSASTYSGVTLVSAGTMELGDGGSVSGPVQIAGSASFNINHSADFTFASVLGGSGSFTQMGQGTTTLTANSSGFVGRTSISQGSLSVAAQAALGGTIDVSGGLLQGYGALGDVHMRSGGTITAGTASDIATLSVASLSFDAGSTYVVNIDASGAGDLLSAAGPVTIGGGTVSVAAASGGYVDGQEFTIIETADQLSTSDSNGDGVAGFDQVVENLAYLDPTLSYTANSAILTLNIADNQSFCLPGMSANQCATAKGVQSLGPGNPLYNAVLSLSSDEVDGALDQLSGDSYASIDGAMMTNSYIVRDTLGKRVRQSMGGIVPDSDITAVSNYAAADPVATPFESFSEEDSGIGVWMSGYGAWTGIDGNSNSPKITSSVGGFFLGADFAAFDTMRFGAVAGYGYSNFDVDARNASADSNDFTLGLYGGGEWNAIGVDFGTAYTWHDVSSSRVVAFPGVLEELQADYNAGTFQIYGDIGYTFEITDNWLAEPYFNAAYVYQQTDGFTETGGIAALSRNGGSMSTGFTTIGVRSAYDLGFSAYKSALTGEVGWRHAYGDVDPAQSAYFSGGDIFGVTGVPLARDQAVISAGWTTELRQDLSFDLDYTGLFGGGANSQQISGRLNLRF